MTTDEIYAAAGEAMNLLPAPTNSDDLFEWHACSDEPTCRSAAPGEPCACSGIPWPSEAVRAAVDAVAPLLIAQGRREATGYARDGEEVCGEPHPLGGKPCQLRRTHDTHVRPASGGFDGWTTDTEATITEARAQGRRDVAGGLEAAADRVLRPPDAVQRIRTGLEYAQGWKDACDEAARIAEGGTP